VLPGIFRQYSATCDQYWNRIRIQQTPVRVRVRVRDHHLEVTTDYPILQHVRRKILLFLYGSTDESVQVAS